MVAEAFPVVFVVLSFSIDIESPVLLPNQW